MADARARRFADYEALRPKTARRRGPRTAAAWALWLAATANVVVIVWLWWAGGNVSGVHTTGQLLTSLGRITGLLSAYLALIQVLLLARLPWLERLAGFDRLTVWHRLNGKVCLYLVLAHVVLTTIGYTLSDRIALSAEVTTLLESYPGMVAATVGTALLVAVVVTSQVIVRRRLRYEAWYLVHLTVYAGIALAWVHQIPTGNEFLTNPAAATYWTSLYLATLVLLVLFRIVQPVAHALRYRMRVTEVIPEGPNVISLRITGRHLDRLGAQAGQFFLWRFLTRNRWWEAHPFSLSAAPDGRSLRITIKNSGDFTSRVGEIPPGTAVVAEGPFGVFTDAVRRSDRVVLIAGGIGITPIRALLEEMSGDIVLLYRVIREEDVVFRGELDRLARIRGVRVVYVVGDHGTPDGKNLLTPEHLRQLVPDIRDREVYLCGPPGMTRVIETHVRQAGTPPENIHVERFAL
ncbi:MAG: ferredoxin reductase family protein [Chloroflexi bacterium]|nr:ferredoxin reductase family protein [Chloroflexota bacterium]